jgi:hypothetical protein
MTFSQQHFGMEESQQAIGKNGAAIGIRNPHTSSSHHQKPSPDSDDVDAEE